MAQLEEGGFNVSIGSGTTWETSGHLYVEQKDLRTKIEHWVLYVTVENSSTEAPYQSPSTSLGNEMRVQAVASGTYASLSAFIQQTYTTPTGNGYGRRYVRATCDELT